MKKGLVFLFSALLLLGLLVSCENNIDANKSLVNVKLGAAEGKGLSASVEYASFNSLDWYYKADAESPVFNYGETSAWTKLEAGLGDSIELSQGIWSFELKAVEKEADVNTAAAVYSGSLMGAQIKAQSNDRALSITIPVTAQMSGDGYIAFGDIKITLRDGSTATVAPNKAQIDSVEYDLPREESVRLSTGAHDVKVWYVDSSDNIVKAEEAVKVTVFGGATTVIEGFLSEITQDVEIGGEDTGSYGNVDPIISEIVIENKPVVKDNEVVAGVVETTKEAAVSNGALTVKLPVGTKLDVAGEVTAGKVQTGIVEADKTEEAVANISIAAFDNVKVFDLTLSVSQDNTTLVEVAYNVGAGLDITQVIHVTDENGASKENILSSTPSDTKEWYSYDPVSGVLTLHIFHASYITIAEGNIYPVDTLDALEDSLEKGDGPIVLLKDIESSEIIVVNKPVTIDGNGKKLTSTAGRAINVSTEGEVVIKDLTIECSGERAINIIQKPVSLTIDNVDATAANYTLNIAGSSVGSKVKVANSTLTGLNVVNVAGPKSIVEVDNCTINCEDDNETVGEDYAGLCLNKDAVDGKIIATDTIINVPEGSDSSKGSNGAVGGEVTIDGSTEDVIVIVAAITYPNSPYYYGFESLDEAIEFAKSGDTITIIRDIEIEDTITVPNDKNITIDLNGYSISQEKECTESYNMIVNNGSLTIDDNSESKTGKIVFSDLSEGGGSVWGSYVICNYGELIVENGTIEHAGSLNGAENHPTDIPVQNYQGKVTINDGLISSPHFRSLRDFTAGGEVIINGGTFIGQVWMQGLGNGSSSLTITGGDFSPVYGYDGSSVYITNGTNDIEVSISGGTFNTKVGCQNPSKDGVKGCITGGSFTESAKENTNELLFAANATI